MPTQVRRNTSNWPPWPTGGLVPIVLLVISLFAQDAHPALLKETTTTAPEGTTLPYDDSSVLMWAIPVAVLSGVPLLIGVIVCTCACVSCLVSVKENKERIKVTPDLTEIVEIPDFDPENFNVEDFDLEGFLNEGMGDLDELTGGLNDEGDVLVQDEFDDDDPFKDDKPGEEEEGGDDKAPTIAREKTVKFAV